MQSDGRRRPWAFELEKRCDRSVGHDLQHAGAAIFGDVNNSFWVNAEAAEIWIQFRSGMDGPFARAETVAIVETLPLAVMRRTALSSA